MNTKTRYGPQWEFSKGQTNSEHPFVEESKKKQDWTTFNAINIANTAIYVRRNYEILNSWQAKGIDVPMAFTLIGGAKVMQLDFEDNEKLNIPEGEIINLPGAPLFSMTITNYGPGRMMYSTNMPPRRLDANSELDPDADTKMSASNPAFKRINLVAPDVGQNARVKIQGLL